ncbi:hypothetical protein KP509_25G075200 [Ceratopteris richardii]|uniref:FHA domain-containing protein n=1 Tax=Ceratopteris richardii TaxID=49495 RepID=A0A8T2RUB9_CERRI|nr:hypothetical protein KP509_25G075200 [Ceratopteris richardii]
MAKPLLVLKVEQGPKCGTRVECSCGSVKTIGRARSNTLQISKDFGISQKHICFQWRDEADHAGWMAMDMGSSNGTIINRKQVTAHIWSELRDGDLIKIGAETSIRVEIAAFDGQQSDTKVKGKAKGRNVRATTRRRGVPSTGGEDGADDELQKLPDKVPTDTGCSEADNDSIIAVSERDDRLVSISKKCKNDKTTVATSAEDIDLNITVEQWFLHMMEEGPKYLFRMAEETIQGILSESKQFDDYLMSVDSHDIQI